MRSLHWGALMIMLALIAFGSVPARAATAPKTAADLRVALDSLLTEHTALAASATNAALGGRDAEFKAAAAALDANSVDLSKAIGLVYGADAEKAFLPLWRSHIGFFVDYTQGVAAKDQAKQDKAVNDLVQYTQDFGAFLAGANPNLTKEAVADLVKTHVLTLKDVVDAQAAGTPDQAFTNLRTAYTHMDMIGNALAGAIAKQFPERFSGSSDSPAAVLRTTLNWQLQEHTFLAASATNAALGGRDAEFKAAAAALDANSVDLSKSIGSVYGADAEKAFLPLWRSHIGFFVDYTQGVAAKDQAKQDKAVNDLVQYTQDFGAFLAGANPNLTKEAVADLVKTHVLTLKDVVDAQAAGTPDQAYTKLRTAFAHMTMIADPLSAAIVQQFPERFGGGVAAAPAVMPNTGIAEQRWLYLVSAGLLLGAGLALLRRSRRVA
ncbi:LPXTG cell wall anchor domain-containing protein [Kallotenue papyrolyticum]|uniref:LPXTG cell wall anchor domain-containing protein n=1 Tax=Kallotenue papyrolyticum TaxID=1325125 RepID=UPI0004785675|nr:LPXTG cell wall anchor domain-containing protein [Kallotenue papyrolyticum]